jgi:transaldolase
VRVVRCARFLCDVSLEMLVAELTKSTFERKILPDTEASHTHHRMGSSSKGKKLFVEVNIMLAKKPGTKILVDGGDPSETLRMKSLIGFVDGQTTNPSLIAKNPEIQQLLASGHRLSSQEEKDEYKKIVQSISPLVGSAGVSIEVFADLNTTAEEMVAQGEEMFAWISNAYVKYPCTHEGLRAAEMSVQKSIRVNMTLCFSQEQAAAVYAATREAKDPVYVSPFIGRLDDQGEDGMDLVRNIKKMYEQSDGHVHVLAASIRSINHLLCSFFLGAELATVPSKVLQEWAGAGFPLPDQAFVYKAVDANGNPLKPIPSRKLDLNLPWETFDLAHELTTKGIQKFVADYQSTLKRSA